APRKKRVATLCGYVLLTLAIIGIVEVLLRLIGVEAFPDFRILIIISFQALIAITVCLYLLHISKSDKAHIRASIIITTHDLIINTGVIAAGVLVLLTQSKYPDFIVGSIVFLIVVRGAVRILKLGK